jgi:hypothetical protein
LISACAIAIQFPTNFNSPNLGLGVFGNSTAPLLQNSLCVCGNPIAPEALVSRRGDFYQFSFRPSWTVLGQFPPERSSSSISEMNNPEGQSKGALFHQGMREKLMK